ncbi:MAG TPA: CapA family protein [Chloroflexia bacterium]
MIRFAIVISLVIAMLAGAFARAGSTASPSIDEVSLVFVGDIMLGRYVGSTVAARGYDTPFETVRPLLQSADLAVGNLEGPLVRRGSIRIPPPAPNELNLTGDDRAAPALYRAGFDLLSLANNHALDSGAAGLQSTVSALRGSSMTSFGLADAQGRQLPVIRQVRGVKVAFLGYTTILNIITNDMWSNGALRPGIGYINPTSQADKDLFAEQIASASTKADIVVVFMHWGNEYKTQPDSWVVELAKLASRSGADLVVGAHPHVAQGLKVELEGGPARSTVVAYSLGNALFDQMARMETRQGLALSVRVDKQGVKSARLVPLEITAGSYKMRVADDASGQTTLKRAALSTPAELQWKAIWDANQPQAGLGIGYQRGSQSQERASVEELGLGATTRVQLLGGALSVQTGDGKGPWKTAWQSEPTWRVTGYTVGDANADGKPDLVYSLWKRRLTWERPDDGGMKVDMEGGDFLPHIYINTWRDGALTPLWHGSPRPSPILNLAVVPLAPNAKPSLAVFDSANPAQEQAPGKANLWHWTGSFGFELLKSLPGTYSAVWGDGKMLLVK